MMTSPTVKFQASTPVSASYACTVWSRRPSHNNGSLPSRDCPPGAYLQNWWQQAMVREAKTQRQPRCAHSPQMRSGTIGE